MYLSVQIWIRQAEAEITVLPAAGMGMLRLSGTVVCVVASCFFNVSFLQASPPGADLGPAEMELGGPRRSGVRGGVWPWCPFPPHL